MPVKKWKPTSKPKATPKSKPLPLPVANVAMVVDDIETVTEVAYTLYLRRGGEHGSDVEDWLVAERMLRERLRG